jgi:hypothetical protein
MERKREYALHESEIRKVVFDSGNRKKMHSRIFDRNRAWLNISEEIYSRQSIPLSISSV